MPKKKTTAKKDEKAPSHISAITVKGFKSIGEEARVEIRPLTILAGANSSGKSSIMQPLLMMKQTLEATYDPGALLINGPNVNFTSIEQLMTMINNKTENIFTVGFEQPLLSTIKINYVKTENGSIDISDMELVENNTIVVKIRPNMGFVEALKLAGINNIDPKFNNMNFRRSRCFIGAETGLSTEYDLELSMFFPEVLNIRQKVRSMIHLPGLRGNPARSYNKTAISGKFPGLFNEYTASVISDWEYRGKKQQIDELNKNMELLGLTWKVKAKVLNDAQIELLVGRLPKQHKGGASDLVNIADVGLGVSQSLPVVVALLVAEPGQMVYLEQPELHLHPHAQYLMAHALADAAKRGVIVVVETHSAILLRGIQTLVAKKEIDRSLVKLHWFKRSPDTGLTTVSSADLNEKGAFGKWPEDFYDVMLEAEQEYLDAATLVKIK